MLLDGLNVRGFGLGLYRVLGSQKVVSFMGGGVQQAFEINRVSAGYLRPPRVYGVCGLEFRV